MRKLTIDDAPTIALAVEQEIARSEESRYDHRLHGLLLVCRGLSCYQVAEYLGEDPVTVQRWVKRFNAHGLAGLHEGERPGRPTRLSDAQWVAVDDDLRQSPAAFGYGGNLWDGKTLAHHLAVRYGVEMGVRQSQRVFGQLDFRLRKPRPVIAQGDPAAQAAYKKTPPPDRRPKD